MKTKTVFYKGELYMIHYTRNIFGTVKIWGIYHSKTKNSIKEKDKGALWEYARKKLKSGQ